MPILVLGHTPTAPPPRTLLACLKQYFAELASVLEGLQAEPSTASAAAAVPSVTFPQVRSQMP